MSNFQQKIIKYWCSLTLDQNSSCDLWAQTGNYKLSLAGLSGQGRRKSNSLYTRLCAQPVNYISLEGVAVRHLEHLLNPCISSLGTSIWRLPYWGLNWCISQVPSLIPPYHNTFAEALSPHSKSVLFFWNHNLLLPLPCIPLP